MVPVLTQYVIRVHSARNNASHDDNEFEHEVVIANEVKCAAGSVKRGEIMVDLCKWIGYSKATRGIPFFVFFYGKTSLIVAVLDPDVAEKIVKQVHFDEGSAMTILCAKFWANPGEEEKAALDRVKRYHEQLFEQRSPNDKILPRRFFDQDLQHETEWNFIKSESILSSGPFDSHYSVKTSDGTDGRGKTGTTDGFSIAPKPSQSLDRDSVKNLLKKRKSPAPATIEAGDAVCILDDDDAEVEHEEGCE